MIYKLYQIIYKSGLFTRKKTHDKLQNPVLFESWGQDLTQINDRLEHPKRALSIADFNWQTSPVSDIHGTICETSLIIPSSCYHRGGLTGTFSSPNNTIDIGSGNTFECQQYVHCDDIDYKVMFISVTLFTMDDKDAYLIFSAIDNNQKISETIRFDQVMSI